MDLINDEDMKQMDYFAWENEYNSEEGSLSSIYESCIKPTMTSGYDHLKILLLSCLVLRLSKLYNGNGRGMFFHSMSLALGVISVGSLFGDQALYMLSFGAATYAFAVQSTAVFSSRTSLTTTVLLISYLAFMILREYVWTYPTWQEVRGVYMILLMKSFSVTVEVADSAIAVPGFLPYLGYLFCPGTVLFGPWTNFSDYSKISRITQFSFDWMIKSIASILFSALCLSISSCLTFWYVDIQDSKWLSATMDALSFRCSHYFVSFMAEGCAAVAGFYATGTQAVEVTKPWLVEFPRSLVNVVIVWNLPMHKWLKKYIHNRLIYLGRFTAGITTFLVSAGLHGFNFRLTTILLSLGIYTYVEHNLRHQLANIFSACIGSRQCRPNCCHFYKWDNPVVLAINTGFGVLAYFHLIYLGAMMDQEISNTPDLFAFIWKELSRWRDLNYLSHIVVAICSVLLVMI